MNPPQAARKAEPAVSDIVMMDALPLGRAIRAKQISCVEVMNAYLDHIDRFNPKVNAIISMRERKDLVADAQTRDEQLKRGEDMGPLHGMPQAIKDLAATKGIRTTQGSPIYKDVDPDRRRADRRARAQRRRHHHRQDQRAGIRPRLADLQSGVRPDAQRLRPDAGRPADRAAAPAWRWRCACCPSPTAATMAARCATRPHGTTCSASAPTYGRVPHHMEDLFLTGLSVKGPMARTVEDLQMLLSVQAGYDDRVPLSIADPHTYAVESLKCDVKGKRIGWIGDFGNLPMEAGVRELCRDALRKLESMGCIVEDVTPDFDAEAIWKAWLVIRCWLAGTKLRPLYDNPETRTLMKPEAQWEVEEGYKISAYDLVGGASVRNAWYGVMRELFQRYDYLTMPSASVFPFPVETHWPQEIAGKKMDTYHRWMQVMIPVTMSGCPSLSVPVGFNAAGLPMGMQIIAKTRAEHSILQLANAYEEATGWTKKVLPPLLLG